MRNAVLYGSTILEPHPDKTVSVGGQEYRLYTTVFKRPPGTVYVSKKQQSAVKLVHDLLQKGDFEKIVNILKQPPSKRPYGLSSKGFNTGKYTAEAVAKGDVLEWAKILVFIHEKNKDRDFGRYDNRGNSFVFAEVFQDILQALLYVLAVHLDVIPSKALTLLETRIGYSLTLGKNK